jgi:ABC-type multidrug transport system ATPase subunit
MVKVQEALSNARIQTKRIANVLSSSSLHQEIGSSIQNLYQQATKLNNFQLPSSRIVGLVGDSGAGKSSLINSLLDKNNLARAVSGNPALSDGFDLIHTRTE